jgi:cobalt/nickel transport protein
MQAETTKAQKSSIPWFDGFTKVMLLVMFLFLLGIFISGKYMDSHKMTGTGTDDIVNTLGSKAAGTKAHPFIELPGDAEVSAFSIANFFVGLIVGHHWTKLFDNDARKEEMPPDEGV